MMFGGWSAAASNELELHQRIALAMHAIATRKYRFSNISFLAPQDVPLVKMDLDKTTNRSRRWIHGSPAASRFTDTEQVPCYHSPPTTRRSGAPSPAAHFKITMNLPESRERPRTGHTPHRIFRADRGGNATSVDGNVISAILEVWNVPRLDSQSTAINEQNIHIEEEHDAKQ